MLYTNFSRDDFQLLSEQLINMSCISLHGQTTPEKTLSNPWYGKGFCEPQQYKSAINRCEGGYESLEMGIEIFKRLSKIQETHLAALREWSSASQKQISQSKESGTNKLAWLHSIRAVEKKLVQQNDNVVKDLQGKVVEKMTSFKTEHYGKSFIHVRKIKDFDKEFKKVQKPWLEFLEKINNAKQAYHDAKRKLRDAETNARITETDVGSSEEQQKKAKTTVERRTVDTNSCKTRYEALIKEMEAKRETYQAEMFAILKRTDEFETLRLEHFNTIFVALKEATLIQSEDDDLAMKKVFDDAIAKQNIKEDIETFNKNYGRETKTKWPVFEDLNE